MNYRILVGRNQYVLGLGRSRTLTDGIPPSGQSEHLDLLNVRDLDVEAMAVIVLTIKCFR